MKLSTIIVALRAGSTFFGTNIGGALDFGRVQQNTLTDNVAFVIPLGEDVSSNAEDSSVNQIIKERFGVVCAIKNDSNAAERTGIIAYDMLHDVRAGLLRVLINLDLGYNTTIEYAAGRLLDINSAWMWYQYEFMFQSRLTSNTAGEGEIEEKTVDAREDPAQLPDLKRIYTDIILSPSASLPYSGQLPASSYISVNQQWADTQDKDDQNPGDYGSDFALGFRVLLDNIIRR